jgi:hypothetical protein
MDYVNAEMLRLDTIDALEMDIYRIKLDLCEIKLDRHLTRHDAETRERILKMELMEKQAELRVLAPLNIPDLDDEIEDIESDIRRMDKELLQLKATYRELDPSYIPEPDMVDDYNFEILENQQHKTRIELLEMEVNLLGQFQQRRLDTHDFRSVERDIQRLNLGPADVQVEAEVQEEADASMTNSEERTA